MFPVIAKLPVLEPYHRWRERQAGAGSCVWKTPSWVPGDVSDQGWQFLVLCAIGAVVFVLASNMMKSRPGPLAGGAPRQRGRCGGQRCVAGRLEGRRLRGQRRPTGPIGGSMLVFVTKIAAPETGGFTVAIALLTGRCWAASARCPARSSARWPWCGCRTTRPSSWTDRGHASCSSTREDGPILASALYGVLLIAVVFVMPGGIAYFVRWVRAKFIRFVPDLPEVSPPAGMNPLRRLCRRPGLPHTLKGEIPHEEAKRPHAWRSGAVALALVAAACGSDNKDGRRATTTAAAAVPPRPRPAAGHDDRGRRRRDDDGGGRWRHHDDGRGRRRDA